MSQFEVETQKFSARSARSIVWYPILKIVAPPVIPMVCWVHLPVCMYVYNFIADLQLAPAPTISRPPLFEPNLRHWV